MMRTLFLTAALAAGLLAAPADPVAWKLQNPPTASVKAGGRFTVKLLAAVQEGWHLYSLKPMTEGPIATRIWLAEGQPFSPTGAVRAAEPRGTGEPSVRMGEELYEGDAVFTLPVR